MIQFGFAVSGDVTAAQDPYFPFEDAVDVWARSFAALGIKFRHATMTLDLCDREGKYSNGFCHWTQVRRIAPPPPPAPSSVLLARC